jgi:metal-responsive CopG/Arc/MetJ family transcriptional regulator
LTRYNPGYTMTLMKTAISIPNDVFEAAEKLARRLGVSRSQLYTNAVSEFLRCHFSDEVTEKLNEIYDKESSELDSVARALQHAGLGKDEW